MKPLFFTYILTCFLYANIAMTHNEFYVGDIKENGECYLVCLHHIEIHPHGLRGLAREGKKELQIKATVIDVIKGNKKKGDQISYFKYSQEQGFAEKIAAEFQGSLRYIFLVGNGTDKFYFDPQDPRSCVDYSEENETYFKNFFAD